NCFRCFAQENFSTAGPSRGPLVSVSGTARCARRHVTRWPTAPTSRQPIPPAAPCVRYIRFIPAERRRTTRESHERVTDDLHVRRRTSCRTGPVRPAGAAGAVGLQPPRGGLS